MAAEGFIDRDLTIDSVAEHADEIMQGPTSEVTPFRSNAFARMFEGYPG